MWDSSFRRRCRRKNSRRVAWSVGSLASRREKEGAWGRLGQHPLVNGGGIHGGVIRVRGDEDSCDAAAAAAAAAAEDS
jgi:hypothetical protein